MFNLLKIKYIKNNIFRFERCRFCEQNCRLQKKCEGSGIHLAGGAVDFLEDFGDSTFSGEAEVPFGPQMSCYSFSPKTGLFNASPIAFSTNSSMMK